MIGRPCVPHSPADCRACPAARGRRAAPFAPPCFAAAPDRAPPDAPPPVCEAHELEAAPAVAGLVPPSDFASNV